MARGSPLSFNLTNIFAFLGAFCLIILVGSLTLMRNNSIAGLVNVNSDLSDILQRSQRVSSNNVNNDEDTFTKESGVVRSCLTGSIYGITDPNYKTVEFPSPKDLSKETSAMRIDSFKGVYDNREWGHHKDAIVGDTASGGGSSLTYTYEVSATLHNVINHVKAALNKDRISILDVPCGDMQWMHRVLKARTDVDYTGMDIVTDMINKHKETFKDEPWQFKAGDVVSDGIKGSYDIVFSRMMMQHLHNEDTHKLLHMISNSGTKFLLTTTFPTVSENAELRVKGNKGRFHRQNLELPPFALSPPLCMQYDGPKNQKDHFIALWKLPLKRLTGCNTLQSHTLHGLNITHVSCLNFF